MGETKIIETAEELEALPEDSVVLVPTFGGGVWVWRRDMVGGLYTMEPKRKQETAEWIISRYGPVTIAWEPAHE